MMTNHYDAQMKANNAQVQTACWTARNAADLASEKVPRKFSGTAGLDLELQGHILVEVEWADNASVSHYSS